MPNTKTRTILIPDIRPENIETITESYTPSIGGGVEQTSSYKVLNTYPIIGGILDKLAFIRTHAAAVWYNKLAKRTVKDEIDDLKRKIDVMPFIENLELKANVAHEITSDKKLNSVIYFFGRHRDIWLTGVGITNTAGTIYLSPNVSVSYRYNTTSKVWTFNANSDINSFSVWT